ncbi:hypothetical protein [Lacinutrix sp. 5H-3-7-4]|uniref:hypothetical protein n=1 Tax=Lacinutrix sp. (strain 5H-3-7-4) TaxID=983544 RepID=UPI00020A3D63|nr:hypothetical protein [Lacinutrix sp. 5H-3-7-4]AEG99874.1 hypothetical protein Lacal_0022 [Lacinutrix sp. 5H-3-7-4]
MDNKEEINKLEQAEKKIDNFINNGKNAINSAKEGADSIAKVTSNFKGTIDSANNLVSSVNGLKDNFLESKKLQIETEIKLKKIQNEHQTNNRIISEEYGKQKVAMDKASTVVDEGLRGDDIEKIREGLNAMTNVANHNPMVKLQKQIDEKLEEDLNKNLDDDDFIIEI